MKGVFEGTHAHRSTQTQRLALHLKSMLHQTGSALLCHRHQACFFWLGCVHKVAAVAKAANRAINGLLCNHADGVLLHLFEGGDAEALSQTA